ncbi:MAG: tRNA (guanine10-N2)-dimethyltransferase [Thermoplasmata archaeon]|nr:tRNA (guanine10-N2)-dimethyltransferase [Thermoplasmata archaeon]
MDAPDRLALLSGEHPTLPRAELAALLAVHDPGATLATAGLVARVTPADPAGTDAALARAALLFEWGEAWGDAPDDAAGLAHLAAVVRQRTDGKGRAAVWTERRGHGKSLSSLAVERTLGAALRDAGHAIDLRAPEVVLSAWLLDGRLWAVLRRGVADRSRFEARVAERREHFSPVGMHPRRAASLVHLARVPPGGTIYDPFCGTGTLALEAALDGHRVLASDLDAFMVQGTLQTLADAGPEPVDADCFVADIGDTPELVERVDGIVTDLPYGRASGTEGEEVGALYRRALAAFARLLSPGGRAVVGHARPELLADAAAFGLAVAEQHAEPAHRSLTRHFVVLERA